MRIAFVPFVVLATSFTIVAAQSASSDPALNEFKIDVMRLPTPYTC